MIYTITSVPKDHPANSARCWGYFMSLDEVHKYIENDNFDIHECFYAYLIVESYKSGIPAFCPSVIEWYKVKHRKSGTYKNGNNHKWIKMKRAPRGQEFALFNWGMG
jgi:hypothetical protein